MKRILVAGIGNIFLGDDGFGSEAARILSRQSLPNAIQVIDFGIRSYDLAYALTEDWSAIILLDAVPRGEKPGTIYQIEIDLEELERVDSGNVDPHGMNPVSVLLMAKSLGAISGKLYLVGCEPKILESEDGQLGLSQPVESAIPEALKMVQSLLCKELGAEFQNAAGQFRQEKECYERTSSTS
jgi:hydrogenase maturation protease